MTEIKRRDPSLREIDDVGSRQRPTPTIFDEPERGDAPCLCTRSLRVRKINDAISLEGSPTHTVGHDPILIHGAETTHSLQAGWSLLGSQLTIIADRLGIIPLYYRVLDDQITVSDSLERVARHPPALEIDTYELYAFYKLGFYLGSATPFRGVYRMRAGEKIVWEDGRCTRSSPTFDTTPYEGTRANAIAEAQQLFIEAIRKRIPTHLKPILPLSGGRDSRHILLELTRQRVHGLQAVTARYIHDYQEDVRVGALVAKAAGVPHRILDNDHRRYFTQLTKQIALNNFETTLHGWLQPIRATFPGRDCLFFDGLAGDALLNSAYVNVLPPSTHESVQSGEVERMAETVAGDFDPPPYLRPLADPRSFSRWLKDRVVDEIARHQDAPDIMCRFMFEHRTRRATASGPIGVFGRLAEVSLPYIDEDLVKFAYRLPSSHFWEPGLHDEMLAQFYPQFEHISFENTKLRAQSKLGWRPQLKLIVGYAPLLVRSAKSTIVRKFHEVSRFVFYCLTLRMADYMYIADTNVYFRAICEIAPLMAANEESERGCGAVSHGWPSADPVHHGPPRHDHRGRER